MTAFGTGVGLGNNITSGTVVYLAKYDIGPFEVHDDRYKYPNTAQGKAQATAKAKVLTGYNIKTQAWGPIVQNSARSGSAAEYTETCFIITPANAITTTWKLNGDGTVSPYAKNTENRRITYQWLKKP